MKEKKARKPRLSQTELNAVAFCEEIRKFGNGTFHVRWIKSRMWGSNPSAEHNGARIAYASGCGYCKSSTVVAHTLGMLGSTPEAQRSIYATGGAGEASVIEALKKEGWILTKTYDGKTEDGWRVERAQA